MLRWNKWCVVFSVWRNDNSSRFGKYLEVLFRDGVITGIDIHHSFIFTSNCCNLSSAQWALPFLLFQFWFWFSKRIQNPGRASMGAKKWVIKETKSHNICFLVCLYKIKRFSKGRTCTVRACLIFRVIYFSITTVLCNCLRIQEKNECGSGSISKINAFLGGSG